MTSSSSSPVGSVTSRLCYLQIVDKSAQSADHGAQDLTSHDRQARRSSFLLDEESSLSDPVES